MQETHLEPSITRQRSLLYRRLAVARALLPAAMFVAVALHHGFVYAGLRALPAYALSSLIVYGVAGPFLAWVALSVLVRRMSERDQAEGRLGQLIHLTEQAARAGDVEALVERALHVPDEVLSPAAVVLLVREDPAAPWMLAGARGIAPEARAALEARLLAAGPGADCEACAPGCPLLAVGHERPRICLPLSAQRPPLARLAVYAAGRGPLPAADRRLLGAMALVLGVALDRARLHEREQRRLRQVEQGVRRPEGLPATLSRALAGVAQLHQAESGAVFLASARGGPALLPIATWCSDGTDPALADLARRAFQERNPVLANGSQARGFGLAVPLAVAGETAGAVALAGPRAFTTPQVALLSVAADLMALAVQNSRLYAELESQAVQAERSRLAHGVHDGLAQGLGLLNFKAQQLDRLLAREQWGPARQAAQELRGAVQDLYAEARLTIQELRWPLEEGQGLEERLRQYAASFADRTGLEVSVAVSGVPNLSSREETQLFHVAQEALTNVRKHAQARQVRIGLVFGAEEAELEIVDDGIGLPPALPEVKEHVGLRIMRERVESIAGCLSVEGAPGEGTRLHVRVPAAGRPVE